MRLASALDAGIDGTTLAAGLHLGSFALIEEHPLPRCQAGIIVLAARALQLFLKKNARLNRLPDYVVVEGPLAGGHLGFGMDWARTTWPPSSPRSMQLPGAGAARHSADPGRRHLQRRRRGAVLCRPAPRRCRWRRASPSRRVRPARRGQAGIFQGRRGRHRGQPDLAHRLPDAHDQGSPASATASAPTARPTATCSTPTASAPTSTAWNREVAAHPRRARVSVMDKTCLCTHMRNFAIWTCGQTAWRLKDTSVQRGDGSYQLLSAEHVFRDYQFSTGRRSRCRSSRRQPAVSRQLRPQLRPIAASAACSAANPNVPAAARAAAACGSRWFGASARRRAGPRRRLRHSTDRGSPSAPDGCPPAPPTKTGHGSAAALSHTVMTMAAAARRHG